MVKIIFALFSAVIGRNDNMLPIEFREYGLRYTPKSIPDTLVRTDEGKLYKIYIINEMGASHVEIYQGGKLIETGNYINSLDTISDYVRLVDIMDVRPDTIVVDKRFEPLKDGEWQHLDSVRNQYVIEIWKRGIQIK